MSAPKHTPGPWRDSYDRGYFVETVHDGLPSSGSICNIEGGDGCSKEEALANARLISGAPELLQAAKWALQFMKVPSGVQNFTLIEALERSIAKAEGRE